MEFMPHELRTGREVRALARSGQLRTHTCGLAPGYLQANLVILPQACAYDFLVFCQRNPKPCPVLEVTDPGTPFIQKMAEGADLRTDLPGYNADCRKDYKDSAAFKKRGWFQFYDTGKVWRVLS